MSNGRVIQQADYDPDQENSRLHYTDSRGHCAFSLSPRSDGQLHTFTVRAPGYRTKDQPLGIPNSFILMALPILGEVPQEWRHQWHAFQLADQQMRRAGQGDDPRQLKLRRERAFDRLIRALEENRIVDPEPYLDDVCHMESTSRELIDRPLKDGFD